MNFARNPSNESFISKTNDRASLISQSSKKRKRKQNQNLFLNSQCDSISSFVSHSKHFQSPRFLNEEPNYDNQSLFSLIYTNPSRSYNKKIYDYPNLIKLNLDDFFEPTFKFRQRKYKPIERLKNTSIIIHDETENETEPKNFDFRFPLNKNYKEFRFHSEQEINDFFATKLDQLQKFQEIENQQFIRNWEKEQINASVIDFQDYVLYQGTKLLIHEDKLDNSQFTQEENLNFKKVNYEHEQLFEKMSRRHEKEIQLLMKERDRQIRNFASLNLPDHENLFEKSEIAPFSSFSDKSSFGTLSTIGNMSSIEMHLEEHETTMTFHESNGMKHKSLSQGCSPKKPKRKNAKSNQHSLRP